MRGVAKVESQQCLTPCFLAMSLTARRSVSVSVGLAGVSEKMSLVLGFMAFSTLAGSVKSTKVNSMPQGAKSLRAARLVPPYEQSVITQWSPCVCV